MADKRIGLTLGKYAPFHKGHQYVIETALREVDELYLLIYDTDVMRVPLPVRSGWIRALYPDVNVIECWDGPVGYGRDRAYQIREEVYIKSVLRSHGAPRITHFFSSEFYGEHVSRSLGAVDRRVDEARRVVPVSGRAIRNDPYAHRRFVSPIVYRDLVTWVVFLGAMSTGKSTIAEALARRHATTFASEYGRDYWTAHHVDRRIPLAAFDDIATGHIEGEETAVRDADRYFFVDTNAITTYMFSLDYHGDATPLLRQLADANARRYDLFFLCCDDIPYDDTWDRSGDAKRQVFQRQIIADLERRRIPYIPLAGTLADRMDRVDSILSKFEKYSNFWGGRV